MTHSPRGSGPGTGGKEKEGAMRKIRAGIFGLLIAAASAWAASAAWQADFTPTTYNPGVGDVVEFAVCETCLGSGGAYRYLWDFNNDGVVDMDTASPVTAWTFDAGGFYEVKLTIQDLGGREVTRRKGVFVGPVPVYGVRQAVPQEDGSVLILISIHVVGENSGFALIESIPLGWSQVVMDSTGTFIRPHWNAEEHVIECSWLNLEPGIEVTFSYSLTRNYGDAAQRPTLSGELSGYAGGRFAAGICGELAVP